MASASALLLLGALATAAAQDEALAETAFARGLELFEARDYEGALAEFERSNELRSSPNSRLMIARILVELDRPAEAYAAYERTIAEARDRRRTDPRFAETQTHAENELREIEPRVGWVRVGVRPVPEEGSLHIGSRELPLAALDGWVAVDPGEVAVRVEAPAFEPATRTLSIAATERRELALVLVARPAPTPAVAAGDDSTGDVLGTVSIVTGGLAIAAAIACGIAAAALHADLDDDCGGMPCPPDRRNDVETGRALELTTWVTGIGGGAFVGLGVALVVAL
jgi:hypothetical protein